jgi:hypothetical protein
MDSHQLIRKHGAYRSGVMVVLRLVETTNRDTIGVLRHLLERAIKGEVTAVAVAFRHQRGKSDDARTDDFVLTGIYKSRPGAAINAASLLKLKLTLAQDSSFCP